MPGNDHTFRTSLRSKSSVDVSNVAALCGGGGHRNAAGCTLEGPLDRAVPHVLAYLQREVERVAFELPRPPSASVERQPDPVESAPAQV